MIPKRPPLLLRVCAELGAGNITEAFIRDKGCMTDGLTIGKQITINPQHQTVDTLLHECLHRLHPQWSENYVRNRTSWLRHRMTDDEVQAVYDEYQRRKKSRRTAVQA